MRKSLVSISVMVCLSLLALAASAQSRPTVRHAIKHDLSQSLREMVAATPRPEGIGNVEIEAPRFTRPLPVGPGGPAGRDTALQTTTLPLINAVPGLNFAGVGANGYAPPDTNGSVGASQFFQITNVEFAIYDKNSGNILLGPALIHSLWNGFGGDCDTNDGGDPVVLWDKAAQRWVVSQLSGTYTNWCMAVSTSSDATGTYYRYAFSSGGNLDDYPKVGVWPDAYYRATNTFQGGSSFIGANACALDRALMLSGGNANEICFQQSASVASLLPSDLDGNTAPPSGEPNFFVELYDSSDLGLFKFHVDFSNPGNSTFTGPTTIPVASYSEAGGIPEPSGGSTLDSLGDRLMFRLAYRNFGDHEALVVNHSVVAGSVVGARWYEVRSPNASPTLFQQGTFSPDSTYRWMGSIAMDLAGDIAMGYSVSSTSVDPGIRYTGRTAGDPLGSMETEASIIAGGGVQNGGLARWGDYSSMSVDPIDDCTFWYTTEYIASTGSFNWSTQIASFKFPNCGSTNPDFYLTANPGSQTVVQGKSTTYSITVNPVNGYANTVNLTVSGCPTGGTCTLNPTSLSSPYTTPSTLTVSTSSSTPGGNYTITVSGTDGTLTHTTSVSLVVISPDFSIAANTKVETIASGASAKFGFTLTPVNTFSGNVALTVTGLPPSSTGTFSPNPVALTYPSTGSSTLTVATKKHKSTPGTYTITVTGTSGAEIHSVTVTLNVTK
ncbi:MAG: COG1470 family protein [Candidatus Sulfotelmatobacter sp.]|jgi:hypothetical protein